MVFEPNWMSRPFTSFSRREMDFSIFLSQSHPPASLFTIFYSYTTLSNFRFHSRFLLTIRLLRYSYFFFFYITYKYLFPESRILLIHIHNRDIIKSAAYISRTRIYIACLGFNYLAKFRVRCLDKRVLR